MNSEYQLKLLPRTADDADPKVSAVLQKAKAQTGFIPNMYAGMANAPGLLEAYLEGYSRFRKDSGFTPVEQEVVLLTISRANGCEYCMAAHSFLADQVAKVPAAVTEAIRDGRRIPDAKLAILSEFTGTMVSTRGLPRVAEVQSFLEAGFGERHVLEIILAIGVKTLSNYANHLLHTPVDAMFVSRVWKKSA